jgi:hypothetical protein
LFSVINIFYSICNAQGKMAAGEEKSGRTARALQAPENRVKEKERESPDNARNDPELVVLVVTRVTTFLNGV